MLSKSQFATTGRLGTMARLEIQNAMIVHHAIREACSLERELRVIRPAEWKYSWKALEVLAFEQWH